MLIEIHMLKNYPPVNLNRDDSGAPKTCVFGGSTRSRVSSQCQKRSWRTSELFTTLVGADHLGVRTRKFPELVCEELANGGVCGEYIDAIAPKLTGFGNKDGKENKDGPITAQIIFFAPEDIKAVAKLLKEKLDECKNVKDVKALKAKDLQNAVKGADVRPITLDMALFGRMVTSNAFRNVEASMQVAHAISTNKAAMESDYFTAMDDLLNGATMEEAGAAIIGDMDYTSACYYSYASLDVAKLLDNLKYCKEPEELVKKAIPALIRTMALTNPSGKQNSFAGNILPSAILIECKEDKIPVSMVNAFVKPVRPESSNDYDIVKGSIQKLAAEVESVDAGFGIPVAKRLWFCKSEYAVTPACETEVCASLNALVNEVSELLK